MRCSFELQVLLSHSFTLVPTEFATRIDSQNLNEFQFLIIYRISFEFDPQVCPSSVIMWLF